MKIQIDSDNRTLSVRDGAGERKLELYTPEAFEILSEVWLKCGWDLKYSYTFSWMGRPIIQMPEDMVRTQEVIFRLRPDVIVETGVAHGGSLVFYASLCKVMGVGRVVGVDIEIRPHNRKAIESHPLANMITLIEGDSVAPQIVGRVRSLIQPGQSVLVLLDSCHTRQHVRKELDAYHGLVSPGSYIVATDGVMKDLHDVPRGKPEWAKDNPFEAAAEFAAAHPEFKLEQPAWDFNESDLRRNITYWPGAWLRRL